jgi:hypothetical protein
MLHDTAPVFGRAMRQLLRNPFWLIFGLTSRSSTWPCSVRC